MDTLHLSCCNCNCSSSSYQLPEPDVVRAAVFACVSVVSSRIHPAAAFVPSGGVCVYTSIRSSFAGSVHIHQMQAKQWCGPRPTCITKVRSATVTRRSTLVASYPGWTNTTRITLVMVMDTNDESLALCLWVHPDTAYY